MKSRSGYVIMFAGCPIAWGSKLKTQIALSTTEAEYIALSTAMKELIPVSIVIEELRECNFINAKSKAEFHCKIFEDNSGALVMVRAQKMRPRTKHINLIILEHIKSKRKKYFLLRQKIK